MTLKKKGAGTKQEKNDQKEEEKSKENKKQGIRRM